MSRKPSGIGILDELSDIDAANVTRCARTLLRRPLLRADGPDGDLLPLVFRHRNALHDLFASLLGYRLVVQRRYARLYKAGPGADPTRGETGLSPRGYAYVALTMAALTGVGRQVLLSRLVSEVRAAAVEAGIEVVDDLGDRRALTAALRHLLALGVITETEGSVSTWSGDAITEALITVDTDVLGHLLAGPVGEVDTPEELIGKAAEAGPAGMEQTTEHAVRRKLVENPVVLHADLPPEQASWLKKNQRRESLLLDRCFGLVTEARLEGIAVTDPEEYLTDLAFPSSGTVARVALLALPELLAEHEARADGRHPVSRQRLQQICADLVESYPAAWSKQATEDIDGLVDEVLELLVNTGLARWEEPDWLLSPVAHRWVPEPDDTPGGPAAQEKEEAPPPPASWSLFDEEEPA
ncbi:TIGR02678 family protein [Crossiella sp. CA198]|uniref:TIGR02678 family protein n=1 Tax=Crossiella sp. CA198 TaxID=3455607 RepID=UPI003F8CF9E5